MKRSSLLLLTMLVTTSLTAGSSPAATPQMCRGYVPPTTRTATPPTTGNVEGITVVVDFSDISNWNNDLTDPATHTKLDGFLNDEFYSQDDNNGSVYTYYRDVSGGALQYTNELHTTYYVPSQTFTYWNAQPSCVPLAYQIIVWLRDVEGFDFSGYDANSDGVIDAFNILTENQTFSAGNALHPHAEHFSTPVSVGAGLTIEAYQVTNLGSGPDLAVFCHETGHLLMRWPDLYGYGGSSGAATGYCLMGTTYGTNPYHPNGYLKMLAGWATPLDLSRAPIYNDMPADDACCQLFQVRHPDRTNEHEFYLIENRHARGRDEHLRESGLAIYAINESVPELFTIVQADDDDDITDSANLWRAPDAVHFGFSSTPGATWTDGTVPNFTLDDISSADTTMTFDYETHSTADMQVMIKPQVLDAPWTIDGPGALELSGSGVTTITVPHGQYTVSWDAVPYWDAPQPASLTRSVPGGLSRVTVFTSAYGSPFSLTTKGDVAATADSSQVVCVVDYDGDGDDEVFVGNENGGNQLLERDTKSGQYLDIAPTNLANIQGVVHAAWGDYDSDGDMDVFLVRDPEDNVLFENTNLGLVVRTAYAGLANIDDTFAAGWNDVDRDGDLDLYLTAHESIHDNKLYLNNGSGVFALHTTGSQENGVDCSYGIWGDYNDDGYSDLFVTAYNPDTGYNPQPRLNLNLGAGSSTIFGGASMNGPFNLIDARWLDVDVDGDLDLIGPNPYGVWLSYNTTGTSWTHVGGAYDAESLTVADFDNDGLEDVYVTQSGAADKLLINDGNRGFHDVPVGFTQMSGNCVAVATFDADNDGSMDLFVAREGESNFILTNNIGDDNNWLKLNLINDDGIHGAVGARVTLDINGTVQTRQVACGGSPGQDSQVLHFGLGDAATVDTLRVFWGGDDDASELLAVSGNQTLTIDQSTAKQMDDVEALPAATVLKGAYPNPFNPRTVIAFSLARTGPVRAEIFDVAGRCVATLQDGTLAAGNHELTWQGNSDNGSPTPSGLYFCRLQADNRNLLAKLTLLK